MLWPRSFSAMAATMRAAMSVLPPAGYATISCTGLVGNACARTATGTANNSPARNFHGFMKLLL
jgi:hypothetical protein